MKLPRDFIDINFAFSRVPGVPKRYVQDRIRERGADVVALLNAPETYVYVCGLKGMEEGVARAFADVCREHGVEWEAVLSTMRQQGRYHLETY
jgi:benzoyl-CoA 2,3-dioxygenase component A